MSNNTSIVWRNLSDLVSDAALDSRHLLLWKKCRSIVASLSSDQQNELGHALFDILQQLREVWTQEGNDEGYNEGVSELHALYPDEQVAKSIRTLTDTITDIAYYQSVPQPQLSVETKQFLWRHDMRELHHAFHSLDILRAGIEDNYGSRLPQIGMLFQPECMGFIREEPMAFQLDLASLQHASDQVAEYMAVRYRETSHSEKDWLFLQDVATIQRELHTALEQIHDWEVQHGRSPKVQNSPSLFSAKSDSGRS